MSNDNPDKEAIDPRVEEELEDINSEEEIFGSYHTDGQAGEKVNTVNDWLPNDEIEV